MPESKGSSKRVRGLELEKECLRLRMAGLSYEVIARNVGCSRAGAHRAVMRAIERTIRENNETAQDVLNLELKRLDTMMNVLWRKVLEGELGAVDRVLRVMERRAKYLGLDAPHRMEHTGKDGAPIRHEYDFSHLSDEELELEIAAALAEAESATRRAAAEGQAP